MTQALSGPAATFPRAPRSAGGASQAGSSACAEEERGRRFDSQRGVEGSSRAGRAGAALLAWLTGRPHSGGVKL